MPYQDPFQTEAGNSVRPLEMDDKYDTVAKKFFGNVSSTRINGNSYMYDWIKRTHSDATVIDVSIFSCNVLSYMEATGDGTFSSLGETKPEPACSHHFSEHHHTTSQYTYNYIPPSRRLDGSGALVASTNFDKFQLKWRDHEFLMYIAECRDGTSQYVMVQQYIVTTAPDVARDLLLTVGEWQSILHNEVWVFDQGYWQKDRGLYAAVQKSRWEDIILPEELKEDLLRTVVQFYDSRAVYERLRVPWKRGLIFYGPPGNGKTISIKATMKTLLDRKDSVPTLYVKSLTSFAGPEYSIGQIFGKARSQAPCYLVFEDLDSMVTDQVRSFFLNAVDGLSENEGILMVGSTNHIERLDPGLAKRPSRFDRKYLFDNPGMDGRIAYCHYWQKKLKDNKDIEFPDKLCPAIAKMMDEFSFAYMQEAFVSTLLKIATDRVDLAQDDGGRKSLERDGAWDLVEMEEQLESIEQRDGGDGRDEDLNKYLLFREIKVQIANLRKELE